MSEPEPSAFAQRFRLFREALGLRQQDIADPLRIKKASVSAWENGVRTPDGPSLVALQAVFQVDPDWLLTGQGQMWGPAVRDQRHLVLDPVVGSGSFSANFIDRPLILGSASCGPGGEVQDPGPQASRYALRRDFSHRILKQCGGGEELDLFFLLCRGESMMPTIRDKEIVLLNSALAVRIKPKNNGIYLVRRSPEDQEARVKRLRVDEAAGELVLSSDNRAYSAIRLPLDSTPIQHLVLGRVCWVGRYLLETDPPDDDW